MQIRNGHLWTIYYFLTIIFSGFDLRIGNKRRICCGPLNRRRKKIHDTVNKYMLYEYECCLCIYTYLYVSGILYLCIYIRFCMRCDIRTYLVEHNLYFWFRCLYVSLLRSLQIILLDSTILSKYLPLPAMV